MINFCIFEDNVYTKLLPLTQNKPIYSCLFGISTLYDKFVQYFGYGNITVHCRSYLKPVLKELYKHVNINNINAGSSCLFYNGRVVLTPYLKSQIEAIDKSQNTIITYKDNAVAVYLKGDLLSIMAQMLTLPVDNLEIIKQLRPRCVAVELTECDIITNPSDLVYLNAKNILADFSMTSDQSIIKGDIQPFTIIYNENNVFIDQNVIIENFVVIDARKGPVYIESDVEIHAHTRLEGPLFIGKETKILGGKISCSSIGRSCKVMGEVSQSIIEHYSNKAHEGFLGHSYIGRWVNLGAGTTTSNLKNNYSFVKLATDSETVQTGRQFLGSMIGDYVKTAVGTVLNCGTSVGMGSSLFQLDFNKKYYRSFSWGGQENERYDFEKFIAASKKMMARRDVVLSQNQIDLYRFIYNQTLKHEQKVSF